MIMTDSIKDKIISGPKLLYNNETSLNVILVTNYNFVSESENELSVNKGDLLKYIEKKPNGWVLVKFLDKLSDPGLIPASYVDIVINDIKSPITLAWLNDEPNSNANESSPTKDIRDMSQPVPLRNGDRVKNSYTLHNNVTDPKNSMLSRKPSKPVDPAWSSRLDSKYENSKPPANNSAPGGKRHNSDTNDYKNRSQSESGPVKPRNHSEPKLLSSRDKNTYSTFNNPYLLQGGGGFKDFKAESFNKFSPPVSPVIPITQKSNQIQVQTKPQQKTQFQSRSNSHSSNNSHGSFGSSGHKSLSFSNGRSSQETIPKINTSRVSHPRNGSISHNPRISNPMGFTNPISPTSPTETKTSKNNSISDSIVIDFNSDKYDPMTRLKSVSISNCLLHNDRYWYRVDLRYDCQKISIGKFYHEFYNLQLSLMDAGYTNLPKLPPPIELNDEDDDPHSPLQAGFQNGGTNGRGSGDWRIDKILKRCNELNNYLNKLIKGQYPEFNRWMNFANNQNHYIYNINAKNEPIEMSNNDINNKILPGSTNLLYKPLNVNVINGNTNLNFNLNKNEINSLNILKGLVNEKINFNHLLINYNGKFDLIDQINWEYIKAKSSLELRII